MRGGRLGLVGAGRWGTVILGGSLVLAGSLVTRHAGAQPAAVAPTPPSDPAAPTGAPPTPATADAGASAPENVTHATGFWSRAPARAFVAMAVDAGYIYGRPRLSLGYGKPFTQWVGVDVNPVASNRFLGAYAGLRAEIPMLDLRVGGRYIWAFQQAYLAPKDQYHRLDFESQDFARSRYTSLEAELTGVVPVGPGSILAVASGSMLSGVPAGLYVYDENLRVIIKPPYVWRGRLGYTFRFGTEGKIRVGPVVDVLGVPGRSEHVVRAGIIGSAVLSDHVEVLGSLVPPILSPDSIGIAGGDFAQLGVRYRWASQSSTPAEPSIP